MTLDLRGNRIDSVKNISSLGSLDKLDLRNNKIKELEFQKPLEHLVSLKVSFNEITYLDIGHCPNLRLVYADGNHLETIVGLNKCRHLDTISMRDESQTPSIQKEGFAVCLDVWSIPCLRKLYLSGNKLSAQAINFPMKISSLQLLDLASCGLDTLPQGFGSCFPNVGTLNLNSNALEHIEGLEGMVRLGRLSLVNNRIWRLGELCQVLRAIGGRHGTLTHVDLRGNPLTVGFYPSLLSGSGKIPKAQANHSEATSNNVKTLVKHGDDWHRPLPTFGRCADIVARRPNLAEHGEEHSAGNAEDNNAIEIDDPYTVPPANAAADKKYVSRLDEATRLRRRIVELMIQASASGRLQVLDGLSVVDRDVGEGDGKVKKDDVWRRLVELGVLRKKA